MAQIINAFPQIGGGTTYDDTERVVGSWFGKPLYQKTYTNFVLPVFSEGEAPAFNKYALDIVGLEKVVACEGYAVTDDDYDRLNPLLYISLAESDVYTSWNIGREASGKMCIYLRSTMMSANERKTIITLRYTKTTD